ncbi:hypothetical protein TUM3792_44240 [Shewanella sp. MBTL60-007]|nr:hypothetical protein [Vibrio parahaemolyticus]GIU32014.1 hypothetical protein TUM3792_44240 [Shewanella sp. MBTL60-007]
MPWYCIVLGADIGGWKKPWFIKRRGVCGAPDAVFFDPLRFRYIAGEFKSRAFNGRITIREKYQLTLYTGLIQRFWLPQAQGVIAYGCGRVLKLDYDKTLFKKLMALRGEVKSARKNWRPVDHRPLYKR